MSKQDKMVIFVIIAVVTILVIGSTFAYFTWGSNTSQKTTVSFTSGAGFSCSANGGGNITNTDVYLAPTTCTDTTRAIKRTVTVSPTITQNDGDIYLNMWLKVNSIGSGLSASQNFKYALTTDGTSCTSGTVVAQGNFNGATTNTQIVLLHNKSYSTTTTDTYYLWIWLDAAETSTDTQNQSFNLALGGSCTNQLPPQNPVAQIATNAALDNTTSTYVTSNSGIDFSAISSNMNGKGIYIRAGTENDANPIYYYRGAVTNNNVLFGGFCWKIVRTTSTGGTKLIYNGVPTGTNSNECNNTGIGTQLSSSSYFSNTAASLADVGYMYGTKYIYQYKSMTGISDVYIYGTGYDETNHKLVTTNAMNFAGTSWGTYYNQLSNNHYTCFNTSGECNQVNYIYYTNNTSAYYVTIPSGKTISGMIDEMLTSSTNTTNSTVKTKIDNWYSNNMTSYTSKLEDTPYCNDRSIYQLGGWSPTGSTSQYIEFGANGRVYYTHNPSLTCNTNDAFTVNASNGNGKLTYPVGLLTVDEVILAGSNGNGSNVTYYLYNNQNWWYGSPCDFNLNYAREFGATTNGSIIGGIVSNSRDIRPVVSLKPGTTFADGGDGTPTNPYVVE